MSAIETLRRLPFLSSEEEGFALFDLGPVEALGRTFDAAVEVEDDDSYFVLVNLTPQGGDETDAREALYTETLEAVRARLAEREKVPEGDVMWMGSGVHTDSTLQVAVVFET